MCAFSLQERNVIMMMGLLETRIEKQQRTAGSSSSCAVHMVLVVDAPVPRETTLTCCFRFLHGSGLVLGSLFFFVRRKFPFTIPLMT